MGVGVMLYPVLLFPDWRNVGNCIGGRTRAINREALPSTFASLSLFFFTVTSIPRF